MKLIVVARTFLAVSGALLQSVFILVGMAWADADTRFTPSAENCPASFDVVDLGTWTFDATGEALFDYGGLLYQVTQSTALKPDQILCLEPSGVKTGTQMLDGKPVPLVQQFVDRDMGARFIQRASGDYVQDVVAGRVTPFETNQQAASVIAAKTIEFFKYVETSADQGRAVSKGPNYTCIYDPENSNLAGEGNYSCVVSIEGLLNPNVYFQCYRWAVSCRAIFQPAEAIVVSIEAGPLKHWKEASRIQSIPRAVVFWSELVLSSIKNFEASIVPRGREDTKGTVD